MDNPQKQPEKRVIYLDELLARVSELKEHIELVDSTLNTYLNHYRELQLSIETIKTLSDRQEEGYIIIDRLSSIMIPAIVKESWHSNLLVNLGLGYYVKTTRDKAIELLSRRQQEIEKAINNLQAQRKALAEEYLGLQRLVSQIMEAQQRKQSE
ncbi:MAG: prefoldin subunit alpha [Desulfurococcaceae archaeon]